MRKSLLGSVALLLALFFGIPPLSLAQTKEQASSPTVSKPAGRPGTKASAPTPKKLDEPIWLEKPFDRSVTQLPGSFLGHSIRAVHSALKNVSAPVVKGQFETTAEFERRVAQLAAERPAKLLFGRPVSEAILSFVVFIPNRIGFPPPIALNFDADKEQLKIAYRVRKEIGKDGAATVGTPKLVVEIDEDVKDLGTYEATNAFGARTTVSRSMYTFWELAVDRNDLGGVDDMTPSRKISAGGRTLELKGSPTVAWSVQMLREDARELLERRVKSLRILLLGTLSDPYVSTERKVASATFDSPSEVMGLGNYVHLRLSELWLFDFDTGRIYLKIPLGSK